MLYSETRCSDLGRNNGNMITFVGTSRKAHTPAASTPPPQSFSFLEFSFIH